VLTPGEFIERGGGRKLGGRALDEHPFIGRTVLPAGVGADISKPSLAQRLANLTEGGLLGLGLDDKVRVTGDVVGIRTYELGHGSIGVVVVGFDFNLVRVNEQLGAEAERFALQGEVDEFNGPVHLDGGWAMRDLIGVELKVEPADGDDFHGARSVESQLNYGECQLDRQHARHNLLAVGSLGT